MCFLLQELSVSFYIVHRHSLPSLSCGFNLQLVELVRRFWVSFLSYTAPGLQLWFYFHLCLWVVRWDLQLRLPWRTWACPCEGQVWRWCSCLGRRGSGRTRYSGELAARAAAAEGYGNQYWPILSSILAWRTSLHDREAWKATVYRVAKSWTQPK